MTGLTEVRLVVDAVIQLWGCFLLGGTGVVSNALSIVVFWRLGFRESINISLMVMAIIDCLKCLVSFIHRGYGLAGLFDSVLEVNWTRVTYLLNAHVQNLGVPTVSLITMYVTFERCLCMCLPLKVKSLLTTKVTVVSLTFLITVALATTSPVCMTFYITWTYDPIFNQSIAQYTPSDYYISHGGIATYLNIIYIFWNSFSFTVIVISTVIIIFKLQEHASFRSEHIISTKPTVISSNIKAYSKFSVHDDCKEVRSELNSELSLRSSIDDTTVELTSSFHHSQSCLNTCTGARQLLSGHQEMNKRTQRAATKLTRRETRLVKMLLLVVLVYCFNILPRLAVALARAMEPEFYVARRYHDLYLIVFDLIFLLDLLGANTHIFIYLSMSSNYRDMFKLIFRKETI